MGWSEPTAYRISEITFIKKGVGTFKVKASLMSGAGPRWEFSLDDVTPTQIDVLSNKTYLDQFWSAKTKSEDGRTRMRLVEFIGTSG